MNQILTPKWFLLQNIKESSLDRNGILNNGEWTLLLPVWPSFDKISKFGSKQVYATKNTSVPPEHLIV
jgi:hypothetical protein